MRGPTRFAMRDPRLTYLDKVREEINNFLSSRIRHNFLKPDKGLSLDLTIKEAEILASANDELKTFAENGDLRQLHERFSIIKDQVETDYLKVRDHIDRLVF